MKRAYSLFTTKSVDEDKRIIEGIANHSDAGRRRVTRRSTR